MKKSNVGVITLKKLDNMFYEGLSTTLPIVTIMGMCLDAALHNTLGRKMFISSLVYAIILMIVVVAGKKAQRIFAMLCESVVAMILFTPAAAIIICYYGLAFGPNIIFRICIKWANYQTGNRYKEVLKALVE